MPSHVRWYGGKIVKQVAFGTARGLTQVAKAASADVTAKLPTIFDRPTPYTLRAIGTTPATRDKLVSKVFVRPDQLDYLERQIEGGTRTPTAGSPVNVPGKSPLNQYGNIPRRAIKRYIAQKNTFVAEGTGRSYHLKPGVYRRAKTGARKKGGRGTTGMVTSAGRLELLVAFKPVARYSKRFGFVRLTEDAVRPILGPTVQRSIEQALASAR